MIRLSILVSTAILAMADDNNHQVNIFIFDKIFKYFN
jgi:hypothetical protein